MAETPKQPEPALPQPNVQALAAMFHPKRRPPARPTATGPVPTLPPPVPVPVPVEPLKARPNPELRPQRAKGGFFQFLTRATVAVVAMMALAVPLAYGVWLLTREQGEPKREPIVTVEKRSPITGKMTLEQTAPAAPQPPVPVVAAPKSPLVVKQADAETTAAASENPALQEGLTRLNLGKHEEAIDALKKAIAVDPRSAAAYRGLVIAQLGLDKVADAWRDVRTAYALNPGNPLAISLYSGVWQAMARMGATDVGVGAADARKTLGEPDSIAKLDENSEQWIYGRIALTLVDQRVFATVDLNSFNAESGVDVVHVPRLVFDVKPWRPGPRTCLRQHEVLEYLQPGETKDSWTRLVTVQRLPEARTRARQKTGPVSALSARAAAHDFMRLIEQTYKGVHWTILRDGEDDLVFQWSSPPSSKGDSGQVEIVRVIASGEDLHRVAVTLKGESITEAERKAFVVMVESAKLNVPDK